MKKTIYLLAIVICVSACNTSVEVEVTDNNASAIFEKNCETVSAYFQDFSNENIDYTQYYATDAIIKGTMFGAKDSITVNEHKATHAQMWEAYEFSHSEPLVLLPGVNPETKEMDGSVRLYYSLDVTLTETQRSVSIPIYQSFDFNENGKFLFLQFYGDINAYLLSLNEE